MHFITTVILIIFLVMEFLNVLTLYFKPGAKASANGVGVFNAWEKSKNDPEVHDFVKYLVYWVAGTKIIFILLMIVIIIFGDPITQRISIIALVVAIATFYWKLFPLIRKLDKENNITPKGYSKVLGIMIAIMMIALSIGAILEFFY